MRQVIKGETVLCWKPSLDDNEFLSGDFLKQKVAANLLKGFQFENMKSPCRVPETKKDDTITKLCPLMPNTRVSFWENLPVDNNRATLIGNYQRFFLRLVYFVWLDFLLASVLLL